MKKLKLNHILPCGRVVEQAVLDAAVGGSNPGTSLFCGLRQKIKTRNGPAQCGAGCVRPFAPMPVPGATVAV